MNSLLMKIFGIYIGFKYSWSWQRFAVHFCSFHSVEPCGNKVQSFPHVLGVSVCSLKLKVPLAIFINIIRNTFFFFFPGSSGK